MWCQWKKRYINQLNKVESPKVDLPKYDPWFLTIVQKKFSDKSTIFSTNGIGAIRFPYVKQNTST